MSLLGLPANVPVPDGAVDLANVGQDVFVRPGQVLNVWVVVPVGGHEEPVVEGQPGEGGQAGPEEGLVVGPEDLVVAVGAGAGRGEGVEQPDPRAEEGGAAAWGSRSTKNITLFSWSKTQFVGRREIEWSQFHFIRFISFLKKQVISPKFIV